jgi:hypothetical protein
MALTLVISRALIFAVKRFDIWLSLVAGATVGLVVGVYLGHALREVTPSSSPAAASERKFAADENTNGHSEKLQEGKTGDPKNTTGSHRPAQMTEAISEALQATHPFNEVQMLTLIQTMRKEDFPVFLQIVSKAKPNINFRLMDAEGPVAWKVFWQRFGEVDPEAALASALACGDLQYPNRNLLEKQLFIGMARNDPEAAAKLFLAHPELPNRVQATEGLIVAWAGRDAATALKWAQQNLDGDALNAGIFAATWGASNGVSDRPDIARGLALAKGFPEGPERASALRSVQGMIWNRPQVSIPEILEFIAATRSLGARDRGFETQIAGRCAALDPQAAANFFIQPLPNGENNDFAELKALTAQWILRDLKSADSWAKEQEGTLHFEAVATEFAKAAEKRGDVTEARRWLDAIATHKAGR